MTDKPTKKPKFDLDLHTYRLLQAEPFFSALSRRINKSQTNAIPTAGVMLNEGSGTFEMIYNPEFFEKLTDKQKLGVLKHEFYHIIFEHVTGRLPPEGMSKVWNIATDLAINSHLHNLPEGGLIPGEGHFEGLPKGQSAEWYMANMPDFDKKEGGDGMQGEGDSSQQSGDSGSNGGGEQGEQEQSSGSGGIPDSLDDHSGWGECSQEIKDMAKERLKETVRKASEEAARNNSWGSVSASVRKDVMKMFETKIDWRKLLRYFVKTSQRADKRSTPRRLNKRFPKIHPGKRVRRQAKIAISIDQSGSVDDAMLGAFFSELNKLAEIAEFTVIPFDTEVATDKVYTWKKGQTKATERVLTGGTCFNAPTKFVNDGDFDGHIVLTDLCAPKPIASKCQRMWMTTKVHAARPYFQTNERVIAIDC